MMCSAFIIRSMAILAIIFPILLTKSQDAAAQAQPLDLRVLVDVSAGMASNDAQQARYGALRLLLELLPETGYAGIWGYAEATQLLVPHGRSDSVWKSQAELLTTALPAAGSSSDLNSALEQAIAGATETMRADRHLLVISDGAVGPAADPSRGGAMAAELTGAVSARLRAGGYRVTVLLLPGKDDSTHFGAALRDLSVQTGGRFLRIEDFGSVEFALAALVDSLIAPERLPFAADQGFVIEQGLAEMTLLRMRGPGDENPTLTDPNGVEYNRLSPNIGFRWLVGANYDLVTFQQPRGGRWYLSPEAGSEAIVLARGGVTPRILGLPAMIFPGELKSFALEIDSASGRVTDPEFLDLLRVEADVISPTSRSPVPVQKLPDGRYQLDLLAAETQGEYRLQVQVFGPTFERISTVPFSIRNPISLRLMPDSSVGTVWFTMTAADVLPEQMQVEAIATRPMLGAERLEVTKFPGGLWKIALNGAPGLVELTLDIKGKQLNGNDFSIQTKPVVITQPVLSAKHYSFAIDGSEMGNRLILDSGGEARAVVEEAFAMRAAEQISAPADQTEPEFELPMWFVAALAAINFLVGFAVFFLLMLPGIPERFFASLGELQELLEAEESSAGEAAAG